jgi:molybdate transport repressor ModE-like protein
MLELRRLRLFTVVAEEGSFTGASRRLNITQSAVSQQISVLEDELGLTLIHRCRDFGGRMTLTAAGHTLLQHARRLLSDGVHARGHRAATGDDVTVRSAAATARPMVRMNKPNDADGTMCERSTPTD